VPLYYACRRSALDPDRGLPLNIAGHRIAVFLVDGVVHAVGNRCLHTGGPLADGRVVDGCVICPWHGWVYELATGNKMVGSWSSGRIPVYPVVIEGDEVKVEIAEELRS
jgi:sulfoxide reductase heme-binding subunit YedZ